MLDHCKVRSAVKQWLKEAEELLIFVRVDSSVVIKDGEQDGENELNRGALKDQEIVVFIEENHLVEERLLLF